jgi:hypothetical protein
MHHAQLLGRLLLQLGEGAEHHVHDLSAGVRGPQGELWVAGDEEGAVGVLTPSDPRIFGHHRHFPLAPLLGLPDADAEVDLEALAVHGEALWVCGSHSSKRKKPKGKDPEKDLARLATVVSEPSRFLLARLPLVDGRPEGRDVGGWQAARLLPRADGLSPLLAALREDAHLGPFLQPLPGGPPESLALPSKDNGLDVEALAVVGRNRVLLGLRGPVLRGHAAVLCLELEDDGAGGLTLRESKKKGRAVWAKHLLALDGLGVRELCVRGDDLLVLAGPPLAHDGPLRLFRLEGGVGLSSEEDGFVGKGDARLTRLFDIPHGEDCDKAEGVALFSYFAPDDSVLVLYDTPSAERLLRPGAVLADVLRLP